MSDPVSAPSAPGRIPRSRRRVVLAVMVAAVVVAAALFFSFTSVYADVLWFQQLGYFSVFVTQWSARIGLFVAGFLVMALPIWGSLAIAYRTRPVYAKLNAQLDRYQQVFAPLRRLAFFGIPTVIGLFAGLLVATNWSTVLLWWNRTPFGTEDPQFGLDTGFYVFTLPFYQLVVALLLAIGLISGLLVIGVNLLYGGIRVIGKELVISKSARVHIAVVAGFYLVAQGASIWLDQYATVTTSGPLVTGATYAAVNAVIPGKTILAIIAVLVAVLFFFTAIVARWRLPVIGTTLLIVSALVLGMIYPWVVQRFQVDPNARAIETPYLQRAITATRDAYGVAGVETVPYTAKTDAKPGALRADATTTANLRLMDPTIVSPAFQQQQQFRQYYQFSSTLDVDRYNLDGKVQDAVVAVRDLNLNGLGDAATWYNTHLVYTHGYGLVAAADNQSQDGSPKYLQSGVPSAGQLGTFEPRVYFGQNSPSYSIVGAPTGASPVELDYPSNTDNSKQATTTFTGSGGPKLDSWLNRLTYAVKFQSEQVLLSSNITSSSQILYDRDPVLRVKRAAPYLTIDSDPYPSVVDGRIVWIVDGYTTTDQYPYSSKVSLSTATADTEGTTPRFAPDQVNYIRNSVKATVDAYSGKVTLYAWDASDPVLKTWQKVFPGTVQPMSSMSAQLMSHVRYPSDLFRLQREIFSQYHVTDPGQFYSNEDAWTTPKEPTAAATSKRLQPPYYLTMQVPGQSAPTYSLYTTFIPAASGTNSRNVLRGYLAVDSDAGTTAGQKASDYGKLRLLTMPESDNVEGPGQVQASFNSDPSVGQTLNILKQGQSDVVNGNLLTVPVGGGLLYVQPVYVRSTLNTTYPLLRKVLVSFGGKVAFEDTLDRALDALFGGDSGAKAGDSGSQPAPATPSPSPSPSPNTGSPPAGVDLTKLKSLLAQAQQAQQDRTIALQKADWAAYGAADQRLTALLTQISQLVG